MKKLFAVILSLGLIIAPVPMVSKAHAADMGPYAKIILGMANSIVGSAVFIKCKTASLQPSLMAYFAGSLVYVAAEVLGGKSKTTSAKENAKKLDELKAHMKDGGDYQKAAIQAQIDDQKSNLSHIKKKRMYMMATKVVYAGAIGLAIFEVVRKYTPPYITDIGGCGPDGISHKGNELAIFAAYNAAQGYASMGGLMGAGLAAAGTYGLKFLGHVAVADSVNDLAVTVLNPAEGRIAMFAAATALVMIIDAGLASEEKRTKKQIEDLEKVLAQFTTGANAIVEGGSSEATAGSGGGVTSGSAGGLNNPSSKSYAIKPLDKGINVAKHCYSNTGSQGLSYSENCSKPYQIPKTNFDVNMDIPTLKGIANTATDMANAVSSGDSAGADIAAGSLNSMAARVDGVNKELLKRLNDKLAKDGKKPIDADPKNYLTKQINDLNAALNKQNPGSGNYSLADVTGSGEATVSATDKKDEDASAIKTVGTAETISAGSSSGIDLSSIESAADTSATDPNAEKVASLSDSLNDFESNENDISNSPDVSIFKQLSNRYILNYTKIFERKKVDPPMAPATEQPK